MRSLTILAITLSAALMSGGCEADEVVRNVALSGEEASLPHGTSSVLGGSLEVEFDAVEDVAPETTFVVWVDTGAGLVAVARSLTPGRIAVTLGDVGVRPEDVAAVLVSEEPAAVDLPLGPPAAVFLRGPAIGELMFRVSHHVLEHATGTAALLDDQVSVMTMELPELGPGFTYNVWLMFEDDMVEVGTLDAEGRLEARRSRLLAAAHAVAVTVESDNGVPAQSPTSILLGEVDFEGLGAGEPGATHTH